MEGSLKIRPVVTPGSDVKRAPDRPQDRPVARTPTVSARIRDRARLIGDRDSVFRRFLALADMTAVVVALVVSALVLGNDQLTYYALLVPPVFVLVTKAMGLYDRDGHVLHRTTLDEVPALFGIATLATLLLWLFGDAIVDGDLGRRQMLGTWILLTGSVVALRALARTAAAQLSPAERCLLIGSPAEGQVLAAQFALSPSVNAELVGVIAHESLANGERIDAGIDAELGPVLDAHSVDRVILSVVHDEEDALLYTIRELKQFGVKVSVLPPASRIAGPSVEPDHLHGVTLLGMRRFEFTRSSRLIKRTFDVVGSATALALLSPLLLGIAIAIRLDSKGPILFRQARVGREGRPFHILKFRSMVMEADQRKLDLWHLNEGAAGLFKIAKDPRVTRVGRFLRRWQLDELPQLVNVLRGEMSLVGPRPLIPEEDGMIEGWYRRRLDVPPGITGHWQILGSSSAIPLKEMVKLDYLYVATWSLWGDFRLLLRTIPFMIRRGGV
jgi:exopolysaccharide biosynthesis polyprenyl glycosylphosphotransferase